MRLVVLPAHGPPVIQIRVTLSIIGSGIPTFTSIASSVSLVYCIGIGLSVSVSKLSFAIYKIYYFVFLLSNSIIVIKTIQTVIRNVSNGIPSIYLNLIK